MSIVVFWIVAGAMALAVAATLVQALRRGQRVEDGPSDLRVYRDQLREVERDLARGIIAPDEAERLRAEVSRRVLDADRAGRDTVATAGRGILAGASLTVIVLAGAFWGYWQLGAPGYPDMPMAVRIADAQRWHDSRPSQAEAEAQNAPAIATPDPQFADLMGKLRAAVAARPDDLEGQELLARNEAGLGNYAAAATAQDSVIALKAPADTADDHAALAEMLILSAGGYVSPEAEAALTAALQRDPDHGLARYYSGLMLAQTGRPDLGFRLWRALLETATPDAAFLEPLRAQIGDMALRAGVDYAVPSASPGPSAADIAASADMSDTDRTAMIAGMVEQLSARLGSEGGPAADWARLIAAYGVLGQTDRAAAIYLEAQERFKGRADDLAALKAAARQANVAGVME